MVHISVEVLKEIVGEFFTYSLRKVSVNVSSRIIFAGQIWLGNLGVLWGHSVMNCRVIAALWHSIDNVVYNTN